MTLSPHDRARLDRVVALLDSPVEGERVAAFHAASRVLAARGVRWSTLLTREPRLDDDTARDMIRELEARLDRLTPWQQQFVRGVARFRSLSEKQLVKLAEIARGVGLA